ncbi:MAG: hypothetical protein ACREI9_12710 [Nitrospiraceae bacterium]
MSSYLWPLVSQRFAWVFTPPDGTPPSDWVLHVCGDELWDDVVEIIHTFRPSLVVVAPLRPEAREQIALTARNIKAMIEEADAGFIQIVVPIAGLTRTEQREFFAWAAGISSYLPAPTAESLNNVKVDFRSGGHYAALAPETFTTNDLPGTWEIIIQEAT